VLGLMWAPGILAMLVTVIATHSLRGLGWWPKRWSPLLVGWLAPIFYGGAPFVIAGLIGAGHFDFSYWSAVGAARGLGPSPVGGFVVLAVLGTLISLLSATGEEIGWRGFLCLRSTRNSASGRWRASAAWFGRCITCR